MREANAISPIKFLLLIATLSANTRIRSRFAEIRRKSSLNWGRFIKRSAGHNVRQRFSIRSSVSHDGTRGNTIRARLIVFFSALIYKLTYYCLPSAGISSSYSALISPTAFDVLATYSHNSRFCTSPTRNYYQVYLV